MGGAGRTVREVISIVMANDRQIAGLTYGRAVEVEVVGDQCYRVYFDGQYQTSYDDQGLLNEDLPGWLVDETLKVGGKGKQVGRKFWQLPRRLQLRVIKMAMAAKVGENMFHMER